MQKTTIVSAALLLLCSACTTHNAYDVVSYEDGLNSTEAGVVQGEHHAKPTSLHVNTAAEGASDVVNAAPASGNTGIPAHARPGECYAQVRVPAKYKNETRDVLVDEGSVMLKTIPAEYGYDAKDVLVRESSKEIKVVPAIYKTVTEQVLVSPAQEKILTVPAEYETVTERVLVSPARQEWKKGTGPISKVTGSGEIMCLVEIPAEYKTVNKRVLRTAPSTKTVAIPAEYKTITKTVIDQPARTVEVVIPAEYKSIQVKKVVTPTRTEEIKSPAQYRTVSERVLVSSERVDWAPIVCETNATPSLIRNVQNALRERGYHPGNVDGVLGKETLAAAHAFQSDHALYQGQLTMETIRALGL